MRRACRCAVAVAVTLLASRAALGGSPGYPWLEGPPAARTLASAIPPPAGFVRASFEPGSFGAWLQGLPLRPEGSPVRLYDGRLKPSQAARHAVVDLDVGSRQQCADVAIRLWAEYLWAAEKADRLALKLTNGMSVPWKRWRKGWRVQVQGGRHTRWVQKARAGRDRKTFRRYVRFLMAYAGTASLARDLTRPEPAALRPGDILVQGGFPGHAVVVLDLVEGLGGQRLVLLGQSFIPAQDLHVLANHADPARSPWFDVAALGRPGGLATPEWSPFFAEDLRRFE